MSLVVSGCSRRVQGFGSSSGYRGWVWVRGGGPTKQTRSKGVTVNVLHDKALASYQHSLAALAAPAMAQSIPSKSEAATKRYIRSVPTQAKKTASINNGCSCRPGNSYSEEIWALFLVITEPAATGSLFNSLSCCIAHKGH